MASQTWVRAGWLIDGSGGALRRDCLLRLEEGIITGVAPFEPAAVGNAGLMDLKACTLLPCLVDCHVHLTWSGSSDPGLRAAQLSAGRKRAFAAIRRHLDQHLACGVAAVRSGGDAGGHLAAFRQAAGDAAVQPVIFKTAGKAWHARGHYGRLIGRPPARGRSLADEIMRVGRQVDHIKVVNAGLNSLKHFGRETPPQFDEAALRTAFGVARRLDLGVMVHANGRSAVGQAVQAGADSIEHGFFMGRNNLDRMAEGRVTWVPTAVTMQAYGEHLAGLARPINVVSPSQAGMNADVCRRNLDHQLEQIRLAQQAGVTLAVGSDAGSLGVHHGRAVAQEMCLLITAGLSLSQAVAAASKNGAKLLGLTGRGELRCSYRADFIAVAGSPLSLPESLAGPLQVFHKGSRIYQRL